MSGEGEHGGEGGRRVKGVTVVSMVKHRSSWLHTEPGSVAPGMCVLFACTHTGHYFFPPLFCKCVCLCVCHDRWNLLSERPRGVKIYTSGGRKVVLVCVCVCETEKQISTFSFSFSLRILRCSRLHQESIVLLLPGVCVCVCAGETLSRGVTRQLWLNSGCTRRTPACFRNACVRVWVCAVCV